MSYITCIVNPCTHGLKFSVYNKNIWIIYISFYILIHITYQYISITRINIYNLVKKHCLIFTKYYLSKNYSIIITTDCLLVSCYQTNILTSQKVFSFCWENYVKICKIMFINICLELVDLSDLITSWYHKGNNLFIMLFATFSHFFCICVFVYM